MTIDPRRLENFRGPAEIDGQNIKELFLGKGERTATACLRQSPGFCRKSRSRKTLLGGEIRKIPSRRFFRERIFRGRTPREESLSRRERFSGRCFSQRSFLPEMILSLKPLDKIFVFWAGKIFWRDLHEIFARKLLRSRALLKDGCCCNVQRDS